VTLHFSRAHTPIADADAATVVLRRLARAARQLRTSDATLAQIATLAGYEPGFSFSRAFKRAF
jgi:AraC-like DNA-binding protein